MSNGIDLNKSEDYVKEFKIFNDGRAGIIDNVRITIERKVSTDSDDKKPNYKVIATDAKGASINEGFYYQEPESKGFTGYQAQRLIMLARGVLGNSVVFPVFNTPREVLDGVMKMVAPALNKPFRVATCYGTKKNPDQYIGFKAFGSFIQPMAEENTLEFNNSDNLIKVNPPIATAADALISKTGVLPNGNPDNLDWMK